MPRPSPPKYGIGIKIGKLYFCKTEDVSEIKRFPTPHISHLCPVSIDFDYFDFAICLKTPKPQKTPKIISKYPK